MEEKKLTDDTENNVGMMDKELKKAFFILRHGSDEGLSEYVKAVLAIENEYNRQKAEIERLMKKLDITNEQLYHSCMDKGELQKQVDALTEERENMQAEIIATEESRLQAVKDTAKEILDELDLFFKGTTFRKGYEFKKIDEKLKEIAERKGVEVE